MRPRHIVLALSVAPLVVLPAHAATTQVAIRGSAYEPPTTTVAVGDTVTWTNQDAIKHTVTGDNGGPNSPEMSTGDSYSYTFGSAGTFGYRCTIHPNTMRGTVTVQSAGGTSSTTSTSLAATTTTSSTTTTRPTTTTSSTSTTTTTSTPLVAETTTTTTVDESTTTTGDVAIAAQTPAGDDDEPSHAGPTAFAALLLASVAGGAALALKRGL